MKIFYYDYSSFFDTSDVISAGGYFNEMLKEKRPLNEGDLIKICGSDWEEDNNVRVLKVVSTKNNHVITQQVGEENYPNLFVSDIRKLKE